MRRDVYIENDSGGFSVLAADAVDAIIEDQRSDDFQFVKNYKALLLELYGDDSLPVRIVVDEPLTADEEAQWLARASWQIDTSDGKMLVMGGFDPDVLSWWKEGSSADHTDGRGVGAVSASPGKWRVDVYAHAGSMNGRVILSDEAGEMPGVAFRRSHPGRAFPLWLAHMLEYSGEEDPGYEELWKDVKGNMKAGKLPVDTESGDAIGFVIHFTRSTAATGEPPEGGWCDRSANRRIPETFPLGLKSEVPDPNLRSFYDKLLDIVHPEPPRDVAEKTIEIIEEWTGDLLQPVEGGPVALAPSEIYLLYWTAALAADSSPRYELWVEPKGAWTLPAATPDNGVQSKGAGRVTAIGPVHNTGGWHSWWAARDAVKSLGAIPDGSTIDFATAPHPEAAESSRAQGIGRMMFSGTVSGGKWQIAEASPKVSRQTLEQALQFVRDIAINDRLQVRPGERKVFDVAEEANRFGNLTVKWDGEMASLGEPDERMLLILASPVFRARFGGQWPVDVEEELDDEDEE
ncbi:MAG: hypothetical protein ACRENU_11745 [Gemmatimonadaceae bacterium]